MSICVKNLLIEFNCALPKVLIWNVLFPMCITMALDIGHRPCMDFLPYTL
jgi:hypothetical protein